MKQSLEQKAELKVQRAEDRKAEKQWEDFLKRMEKKDALIND